jgi:uncharacterized protein DUF6941
MPHVPLALAMIISDAVWTDPGTGKKTILGTFSAVIGREFRLKFPQLAVYLALTDARGRVPLHMRLVDVDELRDPVFQKTIDIEFPDPVVTVEGTIHCHDLVFPEPGEYRLQLFCNLELIIERRIAVVPVPEETDDQIHQGV